MKKEDVEFVRHYLVAQEKSIASNISSVNAIKEVLTELLPEFQEAYRVKYEALMQRSKEAAAWSDFSGLSAVEEIVRILQDL